MRECQCPKGYPVTVWEPYQVCRPQRTEWRVEGLFRKHTGGCPLTDEFLRVRRRA